MSRVASWRRSCMRWSCCVFMAIAMPSFWPVPKENSPWKKNWLTATATDNRKIEKRRPLNRMHTWMETASGNMMPRRSGTFPPAKTCEQRATIVANNAATAPLNARTERDDFCTRTVFQNFEISCASVSKQNSMDRAGKVRPPERSKTRVSLSLAWQKQSTILVQGHAACVLDSMQVARSVTVRRCPNPGARRALARVGAGACRTLHSEHADPAGGAKPTAVGSAPGCLGDGKIAPQIAAG